MKRNLRPGAPRSWSLRAGRGNHRQVAEIGLQVAAFGVELGVADAFDDGVGGFGIDSTPL
jgi:hypothetical protein